MSKKILLFENECNPGTNIIALDNVYKCCACSQSISGFIYRQLKSPVMFDNGNVNIFCNKCASNPCIVTFIICDNNESLTVKLTCNVTFGEFLSYSSPKCDIFIQQISSKECYVFGTTERVEKTRMMCNGDKYVLLNQYNYTCTKNGKSRWKKLPSKLKLSILHETLKDKKTIQMLILELDTHQNLKQLFLENKIDDNEIHLIDAFISELIKINFKIPPIELNSIYSFKLAPFFSVAKSNEPIYIADKLLKEMISLASDKINLKLLQVSSKVSKELDLINERKKQYKANLEAQIELHTNELKRSCNKIVCSDYLFESDYDLSPKSIERIANLEEKKEKKRKR